MSAQSLGGVHPKGGGVHGVAALSYFPLIDMDCRRLLAQLSNGLGITLGR